METPDPTTGLTEKQIEAVRTHWGIVKSQWKKHGVEYFIQLFQAYPNIKAFFKVFDDMDWEEIRKSAKLRAHTINFKNGVGSFIENLDDPECLVVLIEKQSANHFRRKISANEFGDAFKCFLDYAKENTELDDFTAAAWVQTLAVVETLIGNYMKELEKSCDGE